MHLVKDLPPKFERVADEIQVRSNITYRDAVALLTRADLRSKVSSSRSSHSALAATKSAVPNFTTSDDLYCQRCESVGHLPSVCQALQPSPKAYAKYEKFLLYKKNHPRNRRDNGSSSAAPAGTLLSCSHARWIVDSGATDHMSPHL